MKKSDDQIRILQCLGILFVVMGHVSCHLLTVASLFPYYSFHMPLFIFISGYLFSGRKEPLPSFLKRKAARNLIPLYAWSVVYVILTDLERHRGNISYGMVLRPGTLISFLTGPWTKGSGVAFGSTYWFIPSLLIIQTVYFLLHRINFRHRDLILLGVSLLIGECCVLASFRIGDFSKFTGLQALLIKNGFLFPFFHIGYLAKRHISGRLSGKTALILLPVCIGIQLVLLAAFGKHLTFVIAHCKFRSRFAPYLASMNGIAFWYLVSFLIREKAGRLRIVRSIGSNTLAIMLHHQMFDFYITLGLLYISRRTGLFSGIDFELLSTKKWYVYRPDGVPLFSLVYVILPAAGSIAIARVQEIIKKRRLSG